MQPFLAKWATDIILAIPNVLTALLILVASVLLARLVANLLRGFMHRRRVVPHVVEVLARLLYWAILTVGVIMALQRFFDVTAFLAGLGILGFTVGFALQDVMKNFAAGVILVVQQPFRVGEAISVTGFEGKILAIDLRATEMSTFDGRLVSIPNATILTNPITNFTRAPYRRVDITIPIASDDDLERARRVVLNAIEHAPGVVLDPPPVVGVQEISSASLNLLGQFWVDVTKSNPDQARDAALTQIRMDLAKPSEPIGGATHPVPSGADGQQSD